jgi:hypothetical protein
MKRIFLIMLLSLASVVIISKDVFAEDVSVELQDGSVLKGKLISKSPDSITISTVLGDQLVGAQQLSQKSQAELKLPSADDPAYLKSRIAELEKRIQALQAENQLLRRQAVAPAMPPAGPIAQPSQQIGGAQPPVPAEQQQMGYWLTTSSGVRHNSRCRYYMNTKGRPCGSNEGRACKICGG